MAVNEREKRENRNSEYFVERKGNKVKKDDHRSYRMDTNAQVNTSKHGDDS